MFACCVKELKSEICSHCHLQAPSAADVIKMNRAAVVRVLVFFPTESKLTPSAKVDFVWSKLVSPFMFAVLSTILKQYSSTSKGVANTGHVEATTKIRKISHLTKKKQPFTEKRHLQYYSRVANDRRQKAFINIHISFFFHICSQKTCEIRHPSRKCFDSASPGTSTLSRRTLKLHLLPKKVPCYIWRFLRADAWGARFKMPSSLALLVKRRY